MKNVDSTLLEVKVIL